MPLFGIEWLAAAAPVAGTIVNCIGQIAIARCRRGRSLTATLIAAAALGAASTAAVAGASLIASPLPLLDAASIAASALIAYCGASFVLFALVNLGETSLRIQMIERLMANPAGLSSRALLATQSETDLAGHRIRRLKEHRQVHAANGRLFARPSLLLAAALAIGLLKYLLYRRRLG